MRHLQTESGAFQQGGNGHLTLFFFGLKVPLDICRMAPSCTNGSNLSAWFPNAIARISPAIWSRRSNVKNLPAG